MINKGKMVPPARGRLSHRMLMLALMVVGLLPLPPEKLAFVPAYAFGVAGFDGPLNLSAALVGLFGHLWVHAGLWHLLANTGILAIFGPPAAALLGGRRYWLLFVMTGVIAAVCDGLISEDRMAAMVGASGGIAGIVGAVIGRWRRIWLDIPLPWSGWAIPLPLSLFIGLELLSNVALAVLLASEVAPFRDLQIAWVAHITGFFAGWLLGALLYRQPPEQRLLRLRASFGFRRGDSTSNAATVVLWGATVAVLVKG